MPNVTMLPVLKRFVSPRDLRIKTVHLQMTIRYNESPKSDAVSNQRAPGADRARKNTLIEAASDKGQLILISSLQDLKSHRRPVSGYVCKGVSSIG